ncbi:hypothetical protein ABPG72_018708 [Tetrahymena utriculariae]
MISSQKRDGTFIFSMQQKIHIPSLFILINFFVSKQNSSNPLLSVIVDNEWRKESFKNVNIFIPEGAKLTINNDANDTHEPSLKFPIEKIKEWNDIGIHELLGKYTDIKEIDKKDK